MTVLRVRARGPLRGELRLPTDKSIGHRALLFAALADSRCTLRRCELGGDQRSTVTALRRCGVQVHQEDDSGEGSALTIEGVGLQGLRAPQEALDCGNSGTTMRLLAGLLAGQCFSSELVGDASLTRRPMRRVIDPLVARGAVIEGSVGAQPDEAYPPLRVGAQARTTVLKPLEYASPVASAQVKSALLLSGLYARGATLVQEPVLSRDHTERMMQALGVPLKTMASAVVLDPEGWSRRWDGFDWLLPGDFSSAAFLLAAGIMVPDSRLRLIDVGVNPTRTGLLDVMRTMGAQIVVQSRGAEHCGEPLAQLEVCSGTVRGALSAGETLVRMIDEVPALCALAATARGTTEIRDAQELRVKESDRLSAMAEVLRNFGVEVVELPDGLRVVGAERLRPARVDSRHDHRVAMAAVLLGLVAPGQTQVEGAECIDTSFPRFVPLLQELGADVEVVEAR